MTEAERTLLSLLFTRSGIGRHYAAEAVPMRYNRGPAIWQAESEDGICCSEPRAVWDLPRGYGASLVDEGYRSGDPRLRHNLANWQATRGGDRLTS